MKKAEPDIKIAKMCGDFVKGLKSIYNEGLVSVALYGSAASGEYSGANSNVNLAIILDSFALANVARASSLVNKRKFGSIRPVFLTEKYITSSIDVFPLEFLDMKENNIVIYGKDILSSVSVDVKNLRFQCEQELKSKLINIKTAYLSYRTASDRKKLLFRFFTSSLHILKNILRLTGRVSANSSEEIIKDAFVTFGLDISVSKKILDMKNGSLQLKPREMENLFFDFAAGLEKISDAVDRL
ncbi:MAG: hypothetical protein WC738_03220 [Candidatus Omnitrophota bacterium]